MEKVTVTRSRTTESIRLLLEPAEICLCVERASIERSFCKIRDESRASLHHETPVIKIQSAQSGKFFTPTRASGAAMQTARQHVAVSRVVRTNGSVHDHDSSVCSRDSQNELALEFW